MKKKTSRFTFGLEVEMVAAREELAQIVSRVVGKQIENVDSETFRVGDWEVTRDDSIVAAEAMQAELVSPVFHSLAEFEILVLILDELNAAGVTVNESCGIHVHVGGLEAANVVVLTEILQAVEPRIYETFSVHESRRPFAAPFSKRFLRRLKHALDGSIKEEIKNIVNILHQAWYGSISVVADRYDKTRYAGFNIHSWFYRGTVEFRYFNSTLDKGTVENYVQTVLTLADLAFSLTPPVPGGADRTPPESGGANRAEGSEHHTDL
jgi:hypothetical protein